MEAWIKVIVKSLKWRCKSKHMNSSCQEWFLSCPSPKRSYPFSIHTPQLTPGQVWPTLLRPSPVTRYTTLLWKKRRFLIGSNGTLLYMTCRSAAMDRDHKLSLISWNTNGLKSKTEAVFEEVKDADIVFLQETHIGEADRHVFETFQDFDCFYTVHDSRSKGVAILIKKSIVHNIICCDYNDGSYLVVTCNLEGQLYTLVSIYRTACIFDKLTQCLQEVAVGVLVIGGDFNTVLNPYLDKTSSASNGQHFTNRKSAEKFTKSLNLVDIWRRFHPAERSYTYDKISRLDYVFMPEESVCQVHSCEIKQKSLTDHNPIYLKLISGRKGGLSLPKSNIRFLELTDKAHRYSEHEVHVLESWLHRKNLSQRDIEFSIALRHRETINLCDIIMATQSLVKSENPRSDSIPVHFYKRNCSVLAQHLKVLYNVILDNIWMPESFNDSVPALSQSHHHFFNVDYLIFTAILARQLDTHLEPFKNKERDPNREVNHPLCLIMITYRGKQNEVIKVRRSFLERVIKRLKDPMLDSNIIGMLLKDTEGPEQGYKQLRWGCPLTPVLHTLCLKNLAEDSLQALAIQQADIHIYGETIIISLPSLLEEKFSADVTNRIFSNCSKDLYLLSRLDKAKANTLGVRE